MKRIYLYIVVASLLSCKKSDSSDVLSADSTATTDTTSSIEMYPETDDEMQASDESLDQELIESKHQAASERVNNRIRSFYEVTIQTNQYEADSDITWYFDSTFSVVYYKENWSLEGKGGDSEFFIEDEKVTCFSSQENGGGVTTTIKVCQGSVGFKRTEYEERPEESPGAAILSDSYLVEKEKEISESLQNLVAFLKENDVTEKGEEIYTIRIENTINVGQEVTESTEISIPRALYEQLTK